MKEVPSNISGIKGLFKKVGNYCISILILGKVVTFFMVGLKMGLFHFTKNMHVSVIDCKLSISSVIYFTFLNF